MMRQHARTGEVHVRIRLTNYTDAENAQQGLLDPQNVRSCEVDAIVDTGSNRSVIPLHVAQQLGLHVREEGFAALADGRVVPAGIGSAVAIHIEGRKAVEEPFVLGNEVLLGQIALAATDLQVDCSALKVIPNPKHPEGPVFRI